MTDPLLIALDENGVDVATALELRFLSDEAAYRECVIKFLDDDNMEVLTAAVAEHDRETAERAVHTLKGLADSLGFLSLFDEANDMLYSVRKGDYEGGCEMLPRVLNEHNNIVELIKSLLQG